jgi:short-subunit dehydrogenase
MHVLITGASSGIGAALAHAFAAQGASVSLVARREDRLRALAQSLKVETHVGVADLSDPTRCEAMVDAAVAALGPVDVLVNNAGVQVIAPTAAVDVERGEMSLRLNVFSPLRLTRLVLPGMIERGHGAVVNIASMAALAPTPGMTYYNASKCALGGASEALRGELRGTGVNVVTVYPGIIGDTDMAQAGLEAYQSTWLERLQPRGTSPGLADRIVRAVQRRRARVIYPAFNALARWFPGTTRWFMDVFTPKLNPPH